MIRYIIICFFVFPSLLFSQAGRIEPNRPDQSENSSLVPKGLFQIETGFVFEKDESGSTSDKNYTYPTLQFRYGLFENLEVRAQLDNYYSRSSPKTISGETSVKKGVKPLSLGLKMYMFRENGLLPEASFTFSFLLPEFGSADLQVENLGATGELSFSNSLTRNLSLTYNLGASWPGSSAESVINYNVSFGYDIHKYITVFSEVYGYAPEKAQADHRFDFGLTYFPLNNLAFDASAGFGITSNAPDYFINGGFSFRIPE